MRGFTAAAAAASQNRSIHEHGNTGSSYESAIRLTVSVLHCFAG
jgi:hypothetical protein